MRRQRLATLLVLAVLLLAVPLPATAASPSCFTDPEGDTQRWDAAETHFVAEPFPAADITDVCATYDDDLQLSLAVAEPRDPETDPGWDDDVAEVVWSIDTTESETGDYHVSFRHEDGAVHVTVTHAPDPTVPACEAEGSFDGQAYRAVVSAECLDSPERLALQAHTVYPASGSDDYYVDAAPDDGQAWHTVVRGLYLEDGLDWPEEPAVGEPGVSRVRGHGPPRTVAVELCQHLVPEADSADMLVLARDDDYADALAGSALPGVSCILFTPGGPDASLDPAVRAEIDRVLPHGGPLYVLGGENAVSRAVTDELEDSGYQVARLSGPTRYETAEVIAEETMRAVALRPDEVEVLLVSGENWPDAVTAGAYAAARAVPVLLTPGDELHPAARRVIDAMRPDRTWVVGGTGVVSDAVAAATPYPQRIAGTNRMGTAVALAEQLWPRVDGFAGDAFVGANLEHPDGWVLALAGARLSASLGAPQFGLRTSDYPAETQGYLEGHQFTQLPAVTLLGDRQFIDAGVARDVEETIQPR